MYMIPWLLQALTIEKSLISPNLILGFQLNWTWKKKNIKNKINIFYFFFSKKYEIIRLIVVTDHKPFKFSVFNDIHIE